MTTIFTILGAAKRYRDLMRSQYSNEEELYSYTRAALDQTLRDAFRIPFYAERFGGSPLPDDLPRLPTVGRREIGELNRSVLGLYPDGLRFSSDSSSGSTGTPAEFIFDVPHQLGRFAARARYLRENGWTPFKRTAWLTYGVFRTSRNDDERLMRSRLRMANHFIAASAGGEGNLEQLCRLDPIFLYTVGTPRQPSDRFRFFPATPRVRPLRDFQLAWSEARISPGHPSPIHCSFTASGRKSIFKSPTWAARQNSSPSSLAKSRPQLRHR
jgi:hypothetical protein